MPFALRTAALKGFDADSRASAIRTAHAAAEESYVAARVRDVGCGLLHERSRCAAEADARSPGVTVIAGPASAW